MIPQECGIKEHLLAFTRPWVEAEDVAGVLGPARRRQPEQR
jgi:hypothetical protein